MLDKQNKEFYTSKIVTERDERAPQTEPEPKPKPLVGVIMGSDSDLLVMQKALKELNKFQIPHEVKVISAHRTPLDAIEYAVSADERGLKVIIAGAGGAAHLPGIVASLTVLPVIGVPVKTSTFETGLDSLLSIVQMPPGVPVATMGIDRADNAAIIAAAILATSDEDLKERLIRHKRGLIAKVDAMNDGLIEKLKDSGIDFTYLLAPGQKTS